MEEKLNFIITGGGMRTPIDNLRTIHNYSSQVLASQIADKIQIHFKDNIENLYFLHTDNFKMPTKWKSMIPITIETVEDLEKNFQKIVTSHKNIYVIHTLNVNDFKINQIYSWKNHELSSQNDVPLKSGENYLIELSPQTTIMNKIKQLNSDAFSFGFKWKSGIDEKIMVRDCLELQRKTKTDVIIASLVEKISNIEHPSYFIYENKVAQLKTKNEIVKLIIKLIEQHQSKKTT